MELTFEWDEEKAATNLRKHKISFDEAKTIFDDPFSLTFPDAAHSDEEQRYVSIGISSKRRVLVIIHTDRRGIFGLSVAAKQHH
jgi:uncharacterized DUF497 family protein